MANVIRMDEGLYECIAENVAGKVYCSATVHVTGQWESGQWLIVIFGVLTNDCNDFFVMFTLLKCRLLCEVDYETMSSFSVFSCSL